MVDKRQIIKHLPSVLHSDEKTKSFIKRANLVHNDTYDYSMSVFIDSKTKIKIMCNIHGCFEQLPPNHLNGSGCRKCASKKQTHTKENFIDRAITIHGSRYDYSLVEYVNCLKPVEILCDKHGIFEQMPIKHTKGHGCPKCAVMSKTLEEFIKQACEKHGTRYDYSLVEYQRSDKKVKIRCHLHGIFNQTPMMHLLGRGCLDCSGKKKKTTSVFIEQALAVHGSLYDYDLVDYKTTTTKVKIKCKKHGMFEQTPAGHLAGNGCPRCTSNVSKLELRWLDSLNIPPEKQNVIIPISNSYIRADAYDSNTKTIYEFYGDFWHGNPTVYNREHVNTIAKKTFGELYHNTIEREKLLINSGYNLITMWEADFLKGIKDGK